MSYGSCEYCGRVCYRGASHNARVEDQARFDEAAKVREPLSPSPEIRELLHHWHHVRCHSYRPGGACTCWEQKEKLIAELAGREETR